MSRVLVYTSPARGHLYPLVPTLEELGRRGHRVTVRTLGSEVDRIRTLGFPAEPIDPAIEAIEHEDWKAASAPAALPGLLLPNSCAGVAILCILPTGVWKKPGLSRQF